MNASQAVAAAAAAGGRQGLPDPVAELSGELLQLAMLVLRPEARPLLSPRCPAAPPAPPLPPHLTPRCSIGTPPQLKLVSAGWGEVHSQLSVCRLSSKDLIQNICGTRM